MRDRSRRNMLKSADDLHWPMLYNIFVPAAYGRNISSKSSRACFDKPWSWTRKPNCPIWETLGFSPFLQNKAQFGIMISAVYFSKRYFSFLHQPSIVASIIIFLHIRGNYLYHIRGSHRYFTVSSWWPSWRWLDIFSNCWLVAWCYWSILLL